MKKTTCKIDGMHCPSCELLVSRRLKKIDGVKNVTVDMVQGKATLSADKKISKQVVNHALSGTEYSVDEGLTINRNKKWKDLAVATLFVLPLLLLLHYFDIFSGGITVQENMSLAFIFLLGIVASFSSCIAVAGGILLGLSAKYAKQHPNLRGMQKITPHLYFNLGRVISYVLFGALIGLLGSIITLSGFVTGIVTVLAALLMIIIGLQLLQIFPFLNKVQLGLPRSLVQKVLKKSDANRKVSHASAFGFGAFTFFLPCGFTQAMQLFILGVGDPLFGAVAMLVFVLGTLPSFLSIGALASFIKREWLHRLSIFSGVLVVVLGLFILPSGITLLQTADVSITGQATSAVAVLSDGESSVEPQVVRMAVSGLSYEPHEFTVEVGRPVRWIIDGSGARGCAQILTMPKMDIFERLSGETVIEFTPTQVGELPFHCSMAMTTPGAKFIVR